jgi:hypothetical protein
MLVPVFQLAPIFIMALCERGPTAIHSRHPRSGRGSDRFPDPEITFLTEVTFTELCLLLMKVNSTFYLYELQASRRRALSGDIRAQSTPRKQLCFSSSRDSERHDLQLPASPAFRQVQCSGHCSDHFLFQKKNDKFVEERKGYCCTVQEGNQCHVENTDSLTEDLKFPNNNGCPDRARAQCEKRQAEHEKMAGRKEGKGKCSSGPFFLFFCVVVIVALLLAWWKQCNNEIYVVPT